MGFQPLIFDYEIRIFDFQVFEVLRQNFVTFLKNKVFRADLLGYGVKAVNLRP